MKSHSKFVVTQLSTQTIASTVNRYFAGARAAVEPIHDDRNLLERAQGDAEPVIAVVGLAEGMFQRWGVQVYVYDGEDRNGVELVAIGDGAMGRMWAGALNTLNFGQSVRNRDELVSALVAQDPAAEVESE